MWKTKANMLHTAECMTATLKRGNGRNFPSRRSSTWVRAVAGYVQGEEAYPAGDEPRPLAISVEDRHEGPVVYLAGELDLAGAGAVERTIAEAAGSTIALDLEALTFLDAAGMSDLVRAKRHVEGEGRRLLVRNADGLIARAIELAGLRTYLLGDDKNPVEGPG